MGAYGLTHLLYVQGLSVVQAHFARPISYSVGSLLCSPHTVGSNEAHLVGSISSCVIRSLVRPGSVGARSAAMSLLAIL